MRCVAAWRACRQYRVSYVLARFGEASGDQNGNTEVLRSSYPQSKGIQEWATSSLGYTYENVLSQQLVRGLVLLQDVVVDAAAGNGRSEQEAEESVRTKS